MMAGDPAGIGPELVAKLLGDPAIRARAEIYVIADREEFHHGMKIADVDVPYTTAESFEAADFARGLPILSPHRGGVTGAFPRGRASREGGQYCLDALRVGIELTRDGRTDALCFAPLNKTSLHLAGMCQSDELHWFADQIAYRGPMGECNVLGTLWTSRVTSHVALSEVSGLLTPQRVAEAIELIAGVLRQNGVTRPRIAVCGLNPHNGEGGAFGREEIDIILPGIELARQRGTPADGPFPADTIFLKGRDGRYDAIVTQYHDQGQIAMKLMGFDRGVTVAGGLPIPVTTPAHGTAFDIAGQGIANVGAMWSAFDLACKMGLSRRHRRP